MSAVRDLNIGALMRRASVGAFLERVNAHLNDSGHEPRWLPVTEEEHQALGKPDSIGGCFVVPTCAGWVPNLIPGARAVYACTEHDDCREHPEIGVACWRERHEEKR